MIKGISGGLKTRLTTGIQPKLLMGPQSFLCFNQAPETFELFDDIILISEGQIVYQGSSVAASDFFAALGFKCPERKNVADFLQEVISKKDQKQYWSSFDRPYQFIPVAKFAEGFRSSNVGKRLNKEMEVPYNREHNHPAALSTSSHGVKRSGQPNGQPKWLLSLIPNYPLLNFMLTTIIYLFISYRIFGLTNTLKTAFLSTKDNKRLLQNFLAGTAISICLYSISFVLLQIPIPVA